MNHGVVAFHNIGATHSTIWKWVSSSKDRLIIYSETSSEDGVGPLMAASWQRSRERIVGDVRLFSALVNGLSNYTNSYARYRPNDEGDFILMCDDAICSPRMSIVAPPEVEDVEAISILEQLQCLRISFETSALEGCTISQFVSKISFSTRWLYLMGMTRQEVFVVFLSQDRGVSEDFVAFARSNMSNLEIQDDW